MPTLKDAVKAAKLEFAEAVVHDEDLRIMMNIVSGFGGFVLGATAGGFLFGEAGFFILGVLGIPGGFICAKIYQKYMTLSYEESRKNGKTDADRSY